MGRTTTLADDMLQQRDHMTCGWSRAGTKIVTSVVGRAAIRTHLCRHGSLVCYKNYFFDLSLLYAIICVSYHIYPTGYIYSSLPVRKIS